MPATTSEERLQKVLAQAGIGSRRACEELILAGRVSVDGRVVTELGTRVDPAAAKILVDGKPIAVERHRYVMLHKPVGYLSGVRSTRRIPVVGGVGARAGAALCGGAAGSGQRRAAAADERWRTCACGSAIPATST